MTAVNPRPKPPSTLSKPAGDQFARYVDEYALDDEHAIFLLSEAMAAYDRILGARKLITKYGVVIETSSGLRPNPACGVERDARGQMLAALKQLHIDVEPLRPGPGRPRGGSNQHGD